jgi:hypothetical protein
MKPALVRTVICVLLRAGLCRFAAAALFIRFDCLMRPDTEFDLDEPVPMGDLMLASSKLMTVGMVDLWYVSIDVF